VTPRHRKPFVDFWICVCHSLARMVFLGRDTPTPLLSEFMAQVDDTIVEVVYRHGTGGGHVD